MEKEKPAERHFCCHLRLACWVCIFTHLVNRTSHPIHSGAVLGAFANHPSLTPPP
jgi:hypothetical protein